MLGECRAIFTQRPQHRGAPGEIQRAEAPSRCTTRRASRARLRGGQYGDYVLSVGRIESVKRVDLIVRAMAHVRRPVRLVVAGDGTQRGNVERVAAAAGVADRVTFLGTVDDEQLVELYADALAVVYPPYDEDFGYVTLEAFLARKPVITCTDSGGPNEFVVDGSQRLDLRAGCRGAGRRHHRRRRRPRRAARLGDAGHEVAAPITWDGVIEKLVG